MPAPEDNRAIELEGLGGGVRRAPGARVIDRSRRKKLPIGRNDFRLAPDPLVTVEVKFLRPDERA